MVILVQYSRVNMGALGSSFLVPGMEGVEDALATEASLSQMRDAGGGGGGGGEGDAATASSLRVSQEGKQDYGENTYSMDWIWAPLRLLAT